MLQVAAAFALTLAVEVPLYVFGLTLGWHVSWSRALAAALLVNTVTHPLLWTFLLAHPGAFAAAEIAVCVAEWLLLMAFLRRRDWLLLLLSIATNGLSVLAGLAVATASLT